MYQVLLYYIFSPIYYTTLKPQMSSRKLLNEKYVDKITKEIYNITASKPKAWLASLERDKNYYILQKRRQNNYAKEL